MALLFSHVRVSTPDGNEAEFLVAGIPRVFEDVEGYTKLDEFLQVSVKEKFISENCKSLYDYSDNINEILDYIETDERKINNVHDLKLG